MEVEITNVLFLWFLICGPGMTMGCYDLFAGLLSVGVPGVPGVPGQTQILADQLTLFQPGGTDYDHLNTTGTPGFSDLPTALKFNVVTSSM